MRRLGNLHHVTNLESYLIGAFRYRFQRALLKERRYRQKFLLTESIENLESLGRIQDWKPVQRLERELQVQQALKLMDPWTRRGSKSPQDAVSAKGKVLRLRIPRLHGHT